MEFPDPLIPGTLIKRYKRFLSDITLDSGDSVVAHCANTGSMLGLTDPGLRVWLSPARNPARKLRYTWEMVRVGESLVGINTAHPNAIVEEAVQAGQIEALTGYPELRREVRYGQNSRIDLLLEGAEVPACYVEVKNVHLMRRSGRAEFPDAVTKRGAKHLGELTGVVRAGHRAAMVYLVQREDCESFAIAGDIDPDYARAFQAAREAGVEAFVYACRLTPQAIVLDRPLEITL